MKSEALLSCKARLTAAPRKLVSACELTQHIYKHGIIYHCLHQIGHGMISKHVMHAAATHITQISS